jgi:ferrous iron transport protein B
VLERDKEYINYLRTYLNFNEIQNQIDTEIIALENEFKERPETLIADAKYGFITGALKETFKIGTTNNMEITTKIDKVLTNRALGFPIFLLFMWIMFQVTFSVGQYPMDWIDAGVSAISSLASNILPNGMLKDLLVDGIIAGVGGVIVFLPNIMILFFFISFMEDTGYMARASFIMDKLMHKLGLHGKSFIPLIIGFGCGVPAVMATRTLENRKDKILTTLMIPFMSCSARLPVYVLLISAFFPKNQGLVLIGLYIIGVLIAVTAATVVQRFFMKDVEAPFVMELPPYRLPTLRSTSVHMWFRAKQYIKKMGGIILAASIIIWLLGYFPQDVDYSKDYENEIAAVETNNNISEYNKSTIIKELSAEQNYEKQSQSYIGQAGKAIEPILTPLGFDWKIGVAIIAGVGAKEIVVSTMGVLYQSGDEDDETSGLQEKLQEQTYRSGEHKGQKVFTPLVAFCLMLFVLIYFPCIAALAAIKREIGTRWALFIAFNNTFVAWILTFIVFQVGSLFM